MKSKLNIIRHTLTSALLAVASLFALPVFAETFTEGKQVPPTTEKLKPGDFVWEPERAPEGPVLIVVSKPEQIAYVYRNGIRIARSGVSTDVQGIRRRSVSLISSRRKRITFRRSTKARRCRGWSG